MRYYNCMSRENGKNGICPWCQAAMRVTAMHCDACDMEVRGRFGLTLFQHLGAEDLELLEEYLLAGFSIKELANRTGLGYMAIRPRLDRLIARYEALRKGESQKRRILDDLEAGTITADEAVRRLARVTGREEQT